MLNYLFKDSKKQSVFILLLSALVFYGIYTFSTEYLLLLALLIIMNLFVEIKNLFAKQKLILIKGINYQYLFTTFMIALVTFYKIEELNINIIAFFLFIVVVNLLILSIRSTYLILDDKYIKYRELDL